MSRSRRIALTQVADAENVTWERRYRAASRARALVRLSCIAAATCWRSRQWNVPTEVFSCSRVLPCKPLNSPALARASYSRVLGLFPLFSITPPRRDYARACQARCVQVHVFRVLGPSSRLRRPREWTKRYDEDTPVFSGFCTNPSTSRRGLA